MYWTFAARATTLVGVTGKSKRTAPGPRSRRGAKMPPQLLFEKLWNSHVVRQEPREPALLYIDLHLVHEITTAQAFEGLRLSGRKVRRPDLTVVTADHNVPTSDRDKPLDDPISAQQLETLEQNAHDFGLS